MTRGTRFALAVGKLMARQDALPPNRFDMSVAEHEQWLAQAARVDRGYKLLAPLAKKWGYTS